MTWLDISTYFMMNGVCNIIGSLAISSLFFIISFLCYLDHKIYNNELKFEGKYIKIPVILLLITMLLASTSLIPTHDKMFELKIAKIKNEAVTQQNLNSGIDEIKRISRKLECKYLGCNEEND